MFIDYLNDLCMLALNIMLRWVKKQIMNQHLMTNDAFVMANRFILYSIYSQWAILSHHTTITPQYRNTYINILPAWFYISIINIFFNKNKASFHNCLLHVFLWHIFPGQKPSIFPVKYKQEWIKILWKFLLIILPDQWRWALLTLDWETKSWERDRIHKYFILA